MNKKGITSIIALLLCASLFAENNNSELKKIVKADFTDSTAILLNEVTVAAGISDARISPLRLKEFTADKIQAVSVGKTFPEILSNTPGVYATRETGSYGDAQINIRGFKQENISILLNGIPISGLTSGNMYWNNWMGLADATSTIQLQKGIGSSMISDNSMGGTINIITNSPLQTFGTDLGYYYTDYGNQKGYIGINSGDLGKGWAFNVSGFCTWGEGYIECTNVNAWSYLISVSKKLNSRHSFLFTALGSPEKHSQRSVRISYDEIKKYGVSYNKNWGWHEGKKKTISRNNYFKPYFTLNHFFNTKAGKEKNIDVALNSAVYMAIGDGGGYFTESTGRRIIDFIGSDGHIDWKGVIENNKNQEAIDGKRPSANIMSDYTAGHIQFGAISSAAVEFNKRISLDAGIHYQLYNTWEKERITDLLGGDYWIEQGGLGKGGKRMRRDLIRTHNGRNMNYLTVYGLGTFTLGRNYNWILKTGISISSVTIRRWDTYNYIPKDRWSDLAKGIGGSLKTGILYKINRNNSFYLNGGAYSRAPYANIYFASGNNAISKNIKNENNLLGEIGYRFIENQFGAEATFYAALWQNKSIKTNSYKPVDAEPYIYMLTGLNAFHYGGELEAYYSLRNILRIDAFASIGDWRWKNDVNATIYDPYTREPIDRINVYSNNLHVGDAPQTQTGASLDFHPFNLIDRYYLSNLDPAKNSRNKRGAGKFIADADLAIGIDWSYSDRFYADFDPVSRRDPENSVDSYKIPAYHLLNMSIAWHQKMSGRACLTFFFNINNLLNSTYIERGKDGINHDRDSFRGYWGAPRNFNFGVRIRL